MTPRGRARMQLGHLGEYSVANALAAVAIGEWLGIDLAAIGAALAETAAVPGRFELVDEGQEFAVAVDYAHKPDALLRLLQSARRLRPRPFALLGNLRFVRRAQRLEARVQHRAERRADDLGHVVVQIPPLRS